MKDSQFIFIVELETITGYAVIGNESTFFLKKKQNTFLCIKEQLRNMLIVFFIHL